MHADAVNVVGLKNNLIVALKYKLKCFCLIHKLDGLNIFIKCQNATEHRTNSDRRSLLFALRIRMNKQFLGFSYYLLRLFD